MKWNPVLMMWLWDFIVCVYLFFLTLLFVFFPSPELCPISVFIQQILSANAFSHSLICYLNFVPLIKFTLTMLSLTLELVVWRLWLRQQAFATPFPRSCSKHRTAPAVSEVLCLLVSSDISTWSFRNYLDFNSEILFFLTCYNLFIWKSGFFFFNSRKLLAL